MESYPGSEDEHLRGIPKFSVEERRRILAQAYTETDATLAAATAIMYDPDNHLLDDLEALPEIDEPSRPAGDA